MEISRDEKDIGTTTGVLVSNSTDSGRKQSSEMAMEDTGTRSVFLV